MKMPFDRKGIFSQETSYKFARGISTFFVPPTLTLFSFSYLGFHFENQVYQKWLVASTGLIFTFLLPIIFFLFMLKNKKIVNQDAEMKEERTIPFLFGLTLLIPGYFILHANDVHLITQAFWICYISNTAAVIIINKFWKISIHALGAAAPLALFCFIQNWIGAVMVIILLLVGWSRIKLKCHTFAQVIAGALFGFLSTVVQLYLILK